MACNMDPVWLVNHALIWTLIFVEEYTLVVCVRVCVCVCWQKSVFCVYVFKKGIHLLYIIIYVSILLAIL